MEIAGILLVLLGLGVGTYGAYEIYRADFPRNDWILGALYNAASKPSYAVIAPPSYDPSADREASLAVAGHVRDQAQRYVDITRRGMMAIGLGFMFQVIGNLFLLWSLVFGATT